MAEAVPFGIATEVLWKLGSSVFQDVGSVYRVKKDLQKLENTLSTVRAALLDAEKRQETSHLVQDWIRRLKDVVYDADDVLDTVSTRASKHLLQTQGWQIEKVREFFSSSNELLFRHSMSRKIGKIRERLDDIAADMAGFNFRERVIEVQAAGNREREQTHSFVLTSEVIGRDRNKEQIVELLMSSSSSSSSNHENCPVIPIVGIGGLGKTTLAQLVYNDERVVNFFGRRIWVCVTEDFDVELVVRKIITSVTNIEIGNLDMDQLQSRLRESLNDKRYLLVLDDMWNENLERWIDLKKLLVGGARGSRILVTTRSRKVAYVMGVVSSYMLEGLTEEESWKLFKQITFQGRMENVDPDVVAIGKRLVSRCKGLPLAIRGLASVMQFKAGESEWLAIENSEIWRLSQDSNGILPVLKLSYDQLPMNLRQCFAYCSIFPKGHRISKDQLIQLWMAQGYIPSSSGNDLREEIGDQYFHDLLLRSFFQEVEKDECDNITSCKMHDLIHDLAQTVAGTDCCISRIHAENVSKRVRHLSFEHSLYYTWEVPKHLLEVKGLRTFLLPVNARWIKESNQATIISNFQSLRVLDIHGLGIETVPHSVGKLEHLRYLDISSNNLIEKLPASLCNLHNLETLLLSNCEGLLELPRDISKLINLRHLLIEKCPRLPYLPLGLGELTTLRSLSRFIVPHSEGSGSCNLSALNGLNLLRGRIWIKNLECLTGSACASESVQANMKEKKHLHFLGLQWVPTEADVSESNEVLLENLEPHPNLKHLWVEGYGGVKFSSWVSSLRNIVRITIRNCPRCRYLPSLDQLPSLKSLHLHNLAALEYIEYGGNDITSSSGPSTVFFPSLEELWLYKLANFKGWKRKELANDSEHSATSATGHEQHLLQLFPCLTQLTIQRCSELTCLPFFPHLKSLHLINSSSRVLSASTIFDLADSPSPFSAIEFLCIEKESDIVSLPTEALLSLTSLKTLWIKSCPRLNSLSPGINCLTQLRTLEIRDCSVLDLSNDNGMQWQELRNLHSLIIDYLPRQFSLPEGLQTVTTLAELRIFNCYNLEALPLWIGSFSSLQELEILDCSSLKFLPEGMSELLSLRKLKIVNCPSLLETCKRSTGRDWPKIAHIPDIEVKISETKPVIYTGSKDSTDF